MIIKIGYVAEEIAKVAKADKFDRDGREVFVRVV
jgi:hypothetical protein